ncbi:putative oxidoreductase [Paraburkholderia caffeinitolerans]|uniref:Putative oxidoreductase n=1 Tax=Paraburkholderia caffeinitolerans TaxID=1723730 RepID=A0A6J5GPI9_9BURK|nr:MULTISPECIES: SDR family oxidoreductase [Paraburkholderia]CAB3802109.1 putative oxidoreductase [Paraburkholderia caffeinitolerans]
MQRLVNKVVVIAGGGGIGAATAMRLAGEGAAVVIGDFDGESAKSVAENIHAAGGRALGVRFDISDDASVAALIAAATEAFGGVDAVHANAAEMNALLEDTTAVDVSLDVFDRTIAVNLRGYLLCTRHAVPAMLKRGGGAMIYTSSAAAFMGEAERVSYAISKSGIHALMRHVASAWGKQGIRANAVAPGLILTDAIRANAPSQFIADTLAIGHSPRLGEVGDIAAAVAWLVSADGEWVNGQVISVDGGVTLR